MLLLVKAPKSDIDEHETDASGHLLIMLQYLIKHHTEELKTVERQQVGGVFNRVT